MKKNGFVLVMVLFMVSILMLLGLAQWRSVLLFQRMVAKHMEKAKHTLILEQAFWQIKQNITYRLETKEEGLLILEGEEVHYQLTPLGQFPCIQITRRGQRYSTAHIQCLLELTSYPNRHLNIRFAQAIPLSPCVDHPIRVVESEVLSWI